LVIFCARARPKACHQPRRATQALARVTTAQRCLQGPRGTKLVGDLVSTKGAEQPVAIGVVAADQHAANAQIHTRRVIFVPILTQAKFNHHRLGVIHHWQRFLERRPELELAALRGQLKPAQHPLGGEGDEGSFAQRHGPFERGRVEEERIIMQRIEIAPAGQTHLPAGRGVGDLQFE
jgi:hypothetical protein